MRSFVFASGDDGLLWAAGTAAHAVPGRAAPDEQVIARLTYLLAQASRYVGIKVACAGNCL